MTQSRRISLTARNPAHTITVYADGKHGTFVGCILTEDKAEQLLYKGPVLLSFGHPGEPLITSPRQLENFLSAFVDFDQSAHEAVISTNLRLNPSQMAYYLTSVHVDG